MLTLVCKVVHAQCHGTQDRLGGELPGWAQELWDTGTQSRADGLDLCCC